MAEPKVESALADRCPAASVDHRQLVTFWSKVVLVSPQEQQDEREFFATEESCKV